MSLRLALEPEITSCETPVRPIAPGTSIQNEGRNVTCAGGPPRCDCAKYAAGVTIKPPRKAPARPPASAVPTVCPPHTMNKTTSSQGSDRAGAEKCRKKPMPTRTTPIHGAHQPSATPDGSLCGAPIR
jgi:hypothetical protein